VFGGQPLSDLDEITDQWERIKKAEKSRGSALDGIARSQPALALAAKILSRTRRAGLAVPLPDAADEEDLGARLLRLVADAGDEDAEAALRRAVMAYADAVREAERRAAGS
jgi:XTP/dITP diphosphohydrolase